MSFPERVEVMGVPVDPWTMDQTVSKAMDYIHAGEFAHFIGVNADKYLQMKDDLSMDAIVRGCEVVNADGASFLIAAESLGIDLPERVSGIDLMQELCAEVEKENVGVFLLGARPEVVVRTAEVLLERYPQLDIVGIRDGYFGEDEYESVEKQIRESNASLVFVGITSPQKERLIECLRTFGLDVVCIGVGGSFDVISGMIKRAPLWMQKARLEWLFRMMQEPRRLVKRYVIGNARFLMMLSKEKRRRVK